MEKTQTSKYPDIVLGEKAILERLLVVGDLVVHPIVDLARQIGPASLDVRLGTRFQSQRISSLTQIDPLAADERIELDMLKVIDEFTIDTTEAYILHPGDFALASTFEYIKLPSDLVARLEGRSSWARKGLQVHATAGFIDPGFEGFITFELSNVSRLPIPLYPMLRIGQLSFHPVEATSILYGKKKLNKYQGDLGPSMTLVHKDPEWAIIREQQNQEERRMPPSDWAMPATSLKRNIEEL